MSDHHPTSTAPPLSDWEEEVGRLTAQRVRERAKRNLAAGVWTGDDLESAIDDAERRATARQRELLWAELTGDPELSALAAGA
jgi:hypothetical protein